MSRDTKTEILQNRFVDRLRMELVIDEAEYDRLCSALKRLAEQWKPLTAIDKELMQDLYVLSSVTRNMAPELSGKTFEVEEMATELDALVMECLA